MGDIIVEINKQSIAVAADVEDAMARLSAGKLVSVVFIRDSQRHSAEAIV
jgi:S1-C subfamily serine protease